MKYFLAFVFIAILGVGAYLFLATDLFTVTEEEPDEPIDMEEPDDDDLDGDADEADLEDEETRVRESYEEVIGRSVQGRDITAYHFGGGDETILFVGGIHGGYSWNTALLGYGLVDHFETNLESIPENLKVTVIPTLNPDGLYRVVGIEGRFTPSDVSGNTAEGRFNANGVDLNRNFDCNWETTSVWGTQVVDAGSNPFSEPEADALKDHVLNSDPSAVVVYYSAGGGVFSSSCNGPALEETDRLMNIYADASGYSAEGVFDSYKITGDAADWMASINVPAISVILNSHDSTDWSENRTGVEAVIREYGNQ